MRVNLTRETYIRGFVFVVALILGVICVHVFDMTYEPSTDTTVPGTNQVRADLSDYLFINPLLFSNSAKSTHPYYNTLADEISGVIDDAKKDGGVSSVSVYVRDLKNSQWTGVDEDDTYKPSSMLKVVAMLAAVKLAQENPSLISKKLYFDRSESDSERFKADDDMKTGYHTVEDLIGVMIINSDNDALTSLLSDTQINRESARLYNLFRLPPGGITGTTTDFMSPKSYANVFRVLYNSSLLQWNLSEQALNLLSRTTFKKGLVAGVPQGVVVSHKFGENVDELHDCGIVYKPGHPYLICVMTRGGDLTELEQLIATISRVVYTYFDK